MRTSRCSTRRSSPASRPGTRLKLFPWAYRFVDEGRVTGERFAGAWENLGTPAQLAEPRQEALAMTFYIPRPFPDRRPRDARAASSRRMPSARWSPPGRGGLSREPHPVPAGARRRRAASPARARGARQRALAGPGSGGRGARDLRGAARVRLAALVREPPERAHLELRGRARARQGAPAAAGRARAPARPALAHLRGRAAPRRGAWRACRPAFARSSSRRSSDSRSTVDRLEGKFKLSQNRRPEDVQGVAAALEAEGQVELAALMRAHAAGRPESR